jgi:rubredoxin
MDNKKLISSDLYQTILELQAVQKRAEGLGMFIEGRNLVGCPHCHLMEDVDISSILTTYFRPIEYDQPDLDVEFKPPPDTGLRFEEVTENQFKCPVCGTTIQLEETLTNND